MKITASFRTLFLPATFLLLSAGPSTTPGNNPFPDIETYKLKNGMQVIFADYGNLPVTSLNFFINVGKKSETPGQQGLAELTASTLTLGSTNYSRIDLDRLLFKMGASLSASSNENFTVVSAEFLNKDIDKGMDIVSSLIEKPAFPQQDIDEQKGFTMSTNKPSKMDIGNLADMYGYYFVYGIANPLGRHFYQAQYQKLGIPQIKEFYGFNYTPGNTKLVVTGKCDHEQMKKLIEQYFGGWTAQYGEANGSSYDIPPIKKKEYAFVPKTGATQACLEWFKPAPDAGSKDLLAFEIANAVFSDHLMKDIREKRGFTYGIYSTYSETMNDGIFSAKTQVRNAVMDSTVNAFDEALNKFYTTGVTAAELAKMKTMRRSGILRIEEPQSFAGFINPLVYKDYNKRKQILADIDALDLAAVNKAVKKYFSPDAYKLMIAGDPGALADQLTKIQGLQKLDLSVIEHDQ